jgi:hypothetical protein
VTSIDIHFRDGPVCTYEGIKRCELDNQRISGFDQSGRLAMFLPLEVIDWIDVSDTQRSVKAVAVKNAG